MARLFSDEKLPTYLKYLELLSLLGSFFYYVFDNFLWLIQSNILNFFSDDKVAKFKYVKDLGSFWRLIFHTGVTLLTLRVCFEKQKEIKSKLKEGEEVVRKDSQQSRDIEEYLNARFDARSAFLELMISSVRIIMLWKSLRFFM